MTQTNMNYDAPENMLAMDVYNKLNERFKKRSIGQLVGTMHHIDTKILNNGDFRVQGWIELEEFLKIMQGNPIDMLFRINGNKVEIWCLIIDKFYLS